MKTIFASLYLKFSFFNLSFNCRSRKSLIEKDGKVILSKFFKILKCSNIYYNCKGYKDKFTSFFKNNSPHPPYFSLFPLLPIFLILSPPFESHKSLIVVAIIDNSIKIYYTTL